MKNPILSLIIALCIPFTVRAADFRNTTWGMTQQEVIQAEDDEPADQTGAILIYHTEVLEMDMIIRYVFAQNQLIGAKYILAKKQIVDRKYVEHYETLQSILTRKYGAPLKKEEIWQKGEYFRDDKSQWGVAVSTGKLTCRSTWRTPATDIEIVLKGGNFKVSCEITYWSRKLRHLANKRQNMMKSSTGGDDRMKEVLKQF